MKAKDDLSNVFFYDKNINVKKMSFMFPLQVAKVDFDQVIFGMGVCTT